VLVLVAVADRDHNAEIEIKLRFERGERLDNSNIDGTSYGVG